MNPDLVFIVTYECPRCHAALEARSGETPAWLRCPSCGRASLPPEPVRHAAVSRSEGRGSEADPSAVPSAAGRVALPIAPRPMAARPSGSASRAQSTRLMLGSTFFATGILFLFAILEANALHASLFAVAAAISLFLLTRSTGPNLRR